MNPADNMTGMRAHFLKLAVIISLFFFGACGMDAVIYSDTGINGGEYSADNETQNDESGNEFDLEDNTNTDPNPSEEITQNGFDLPEFTQNGFGSPLDEADEKLYVEAYDFESGNEDFGHDTYYTPPLADAPDSLKEINACCILHHRYTNTLTPDEDIDEFLETADIEECPDLDDHTFYDTAEQCGPFIHDSLENVFGDYVAETYSIKGMIVYKNPSQFAPFFANQAYEDE